VVSFGKIKPALTYLFNVSRAIIVITASRWGAWALRAIQGHVRSGKAGDAGRRKSGALVVKKENGSPFSLSPGAAMTPGGDPACSGARLGARRRAGRLGPARLANAVEGCRQPRLVRRAVPEPCTGAVDNISSGWPRVLALSHWYPKADPMVLVY
jgi:hypothetical protein